MKAEDSLGLVEAWPEPILLVREDGILVAASRACEELLCLNGKGLAGASLSALGECAPGAEEYIRLCSRTRALLPGALSVTKPQGATINLHMAGFVLRPAQDGAPALVLLRLKPALSAAHQFLALNQKIEDLSKEVRQRIEMQQRLERSVQEKEVLLREINHRVKNNLQVIAALLDDQANQINDPAALAALNESRARIHVMGLVHRLLYSLPDLREVDLASFLYRVTEELLQLYRRPGLTVVSSFQMESVNVGTEQAINSGLLVHELVSNVAKHAFVGRQAGMLHIVLKGLSDEQFLLEVSDDGVGMPEIDGSSPMKLGLELIKSLAKQMRGTVELKSSKGTTFSITLARLPLGASASLLPPPTVGRSHLPRAKRRYSGDRTR